MTDNTSSASYGQNEFKTIMDIFKKEETKLLNHHKFQAIVSKFWALLTKDETGRITKDEYFKLMHLIYKVLLPFYKKEEMDAEIANEWVFDCGGRINLDYTLLSRTLFRVAHWWCVHIDYEEYSFFLRKIYERITCKVIVKADSRVKVLPKIIVSFPEEERKIQRIEDEDALGDDNTPEENAHRDWIECDEDESERSDYEYKYGDDNDTMDLKRYKRPRQQDSGVLMAVTHIKDPFLYRESVEYDFEEVEEGSSTINQIMGEEYVLPFGYPSEQYLFKLKNDVFDVVNEYKEKNKNNDDDMKDFIDPGDLKVENKTVEQTFFLFTNNGFHKEYRFVA